MSPDMSQQGQCFHANFSTPFRVSEVRAVLQGAARGQARATARLNIPRIFLNTAASPASHSPAVAERPREAPPQRTR